MSKVKVALIGFGHLGKWHAQKANSLANLVAIVEPFPANQTLARENYPNVKIVSDIKEVVDEIDAAIIVTPTSFHFNVAKYLLENKKHIFCEKPLCSSMEEVNLLTPLIDKNYVFQVGHSERCHAAWDNLKEEFSNISSKFTIDLNRVAAFKGRATDVDVVSDLMIHDLDLVYYLFNKLPVRLKAYGHKIRTDKWDTVTCVMEYDNGSMAKITSSRNHVKEIRSLEVNHDGGCIYVDLFTNEYFVANSSTYPDGSFVKQSKYEKRDHLLIEQQSFFNAIESKSKPMVTFDDGAKIVHLIDLVLLSLETQKTIEI